MAWTASDTFDGYSTGNIAGQSGGTGWTGTWVNVSPTGTWTVTTTTPYQGTQCVTRNGSEHSGIEHQLAADVSGNFVMYVALKMGTMSSNATNFSLRNTADNGSLTLVFGTDGTVKGADGSTIFASYAADTWTVYRISKTSSTTYVVARSTDAYGSAGSFSADSSSITISNTGDIRYLLLDGNDSNGNRSMDYISGVTPFVAAGPTNVKTFDGVTQSTGIKTYFGVTLANTKTVDGIA